MTNAQFERMVRRDKFVRTANMVLVYVFLTLATLLVLYPVVYLISAAFTPGSSISNSFECFVTQSLKVSHFSCSQLGFSSNRLLAWVLIQVTAVSTSILSVDLIPALFATSASNTVVARRCSAFAASNATGPQPVPTGLL